MVDLQGPQIRTGSNKDGAVLPISAGQPLKIVSDMEIEGDGLTIATTFPLPVSVDQTIYIADGQLSCVVQSIEGDVIEVKCQNSWDLEQNSTVHLPGVPLDMFQPTEKDIADITSFILENQIDYVQIPSVKKPEEVQNVRAKLGIQGAHIKIISKIETSEGLENFDAILQESDGINIVRKTLGIDIPVEKVFIAQKWMTWRAQLASKTVIVSSQVLESMVSNIKATEAEVFDIANVVNDGIDCI